MRTSLALLAVGVALEVLELPIRGTSGSPRPSSSWCSGCWLPCTRG
ncbi:hypothetical protein [Cryobacterium sp. 10C3]|nr:hypothetical protein [Cryobacterium sp. 10C3]MDY7557297.1 hypothetical protein [Cryobacterium sp. 10C3]